MRTRAGWIVLIGLGACLAAGAAAAEDRRELEASLFSSEADSSTATAEAPLPVAIPTPDPKTVGFSGQITSALVDQISNSHAANYLYTYTVGTFYLDARLARGAKVFANLEADYLSQSQTTAVFLRELFFDFNLDRAIYLRTGKQVLQWGRCYLWNPTDLINVERPQFVAKIGAREGAYGIKAHVPFGTAANFYGFLDTGSAPNAETAAGAVKAEFLLGNFEVAFSGWSKKGYRPVWGLDFSTRILGIDALGEVALSQGDNRSRARVRNGVLTLETDNTAWTPRASLDFSRSFTVGNFKDRLTVMVEGYYDRAGYETNVLGDATEYPFAQPVTVDGTPAVRGTQQEFIRALNLYQPNYLSRAYVALFTTFNRFILTDLSLSLNYIQNLVDYSGLLSTGVTYADQNGFTAGLLVNADLGGPDKEYTFAGEKYNIQMTFGISF